MVRALLYMRKDMPTDPPRGVDRIRATLYEVLEQAYTGRAPAPHDTTSRPARQDAAVS